MRATRHGAKLRVRRRASSAQRFLYAAVAASSNAAIDTMPLSEVDDPVVDASALKSPGMRDGEM